MIRYALVLPALVACSDVDTQYAAHEAAERGPATLLEYGVVAFLNDAGTTVDVLDFDVPLDARAASNLIAHRDADLFDDIDEVDAVAYVGPAALHSLELYVEANGWVPANEDVMGVYDGVTFTFGEAAATLELANTAEVQVLDDEIPLDARAVDSIVEARPIVSVDDLAGLYFVGGTALTRLRDFTLVEEPPVEANGWSDDFTHDEELDIPDGDFDGIVSEVHVMQAPDEATVITFSADIIHDETTQIEVELRAPNGARYLLWDFEPHPEVWHKLDGDWDYGTNANGTWTLLVRDLTPGTSGVIRGWNLHVATPE